MGNYLEMADVNKIEALLDLGWSHRKIARALGIHWTTVTRSPKPTNLIAGSGDLENRPNPIAGSESDRARSGPASMADAHGDYIVKGVEQGLSAQRIWQDLVRSGGTRPGT